MSESTDSQMAAVGRNIVFPGESGPTQGDCQIGSKVPELGAGGLRGSGSGEGASRRRC
jgi:hypothetical protein